MEGRRTSNNETRLYCTILCTGLGKPLSLWSAWLDLENVFRFHFGVSVVKPTLLGCQLLSCASKVFQPHSDERNCFSPSSFRWCICEVYAYNICIRVQQQYILLLLYYSSWERNFAFSLLL
jgi:hypothetical protein